MALGCMQAVPLTGGGVLGGPVAKAVFGGSERWGSLLAAGGTAPLHVHMWSLQREQCILQVGVMPPSLPPIEASTSGLWGMHCIRKLQLCQARSRPWACMLDMLFCQEVRLIAVQSQKPSALLPPARHASLTEVGC